MTTLAAHIQTANAKLANWYKNAKRDYAVIGEGKATVEGDRFIINYTEDGVAKNWSMKFWTEERYDVDYFFNVWMEQA
jgi:hypothetical protein